MPRSRRGVWLALLAAGCAAHAAAPPRDVARAPASPPGHVPVAPARADAKPAAPAVPPAGSALWATHFGGGGSAQGTGIAVDAGGDIVVTGQYTRDIAFGAARYQSQGLEDVFVVKLDSGGKPLWSHSYGGKGHDYASGAAVDSTGNIYLTGFFTGAIDFGSGLLRSKGVHDIFLAKLSADGKVLWSRRYGDGADQVSLRVFPDAAGHLVAAGYARGTVRFAKKNLSSYPDKATFIAQLAADGSALWSTGFGHIYDYAFPAAVTDGSGHVFFSAGSDPSPEFGGPAKHKPREMDLGLVLGELDARGKVVWKKRIGGGSDNMETLIGLEPNGDIVTAGTFSGHLDFGGGEYRSTSLSDLFVARLTDKGEHVWSRRFSGTRMQSISGMRVASDGSVTVVGQFSKGKLDMQVKQLEGLGSENGFVARLASDSHVEWARCICTGRLDWLSAVALDGAGSPIVTGAFLGSFDLGSGSVDSTGQEDVLVAKLRP